MANAQISTSQPVLPDCQSSQDIMGKLKYSWHLIPESTWLKDISQDLVHEAVQILVEKLKTVEP